MKVTVYLWAKDGEETFASCRLPNKERREILRRQGWVFYCTVVELNRPEDVVEIK